MTQLKIDFNLRAFALVCFSLLAMTHSSCADPIVDQERNLEPFTGIKVGGAFNLIMNQSGRHKVLIEAEEDIIEKVRTEVKGDVLHIDMKWDWSWDDHGEVTIYVDFDELSLLDVSGASNVKAETPIRAEDLEIRVSGAGDMDLEVEATAMDVTVSGAGDVSISGNTETQKVRLSGAGDYEAQHLRSKYTDARASGAGSVVVFASEEIEASASGAGSVKYFGDPDREKTNSSGAGSISRH